MAAAAVNGSNKKANAFLLKEGTKGKGKKKITMVKANMNTAHGGLSDLTNINQQIPINTYSKESICIQKHANNIMPPPPCFIIGFTAFPLTEIS